MRRLSRPLSVSLLVAVLAAPGCTLLLAGAAGGAAAGGVTAAQASEREEHSPMTYVGVVVGNIVYVPAKIIFAGLGAGTAGIAYLVSGANPEASRPIWTSAVEGSYVLTPNMVAGREPVRFVGP